MHSDSSQVLGPRRCIGTAVSIELVTLMFGWRTCQRNTARVSGSESGYSPAPNCVLPRPVASVIGRQLYG